MVRKVALATIFLLIFINSLVILKFPAEIYIGYLGIFLLLPKFIFRFGIPKVMGIIFSILALTGVFYIAGGSNEAGQFIKIFLGVFMSYLFFYHAISYFNYDVKFLFTLYLKGVWIVTIIGIIQFVSFIVGIKFGYDFSWILNKWGFIRGGNFGIRVNSLFGEPTYFATFLSPAVFVSIHNLIKKKNFVYKKYQNVLILLTYLLSFSGNAYLAIALSFVLLLVNYGVVRYSLILIPLLVIGITYANNNIEEFGSRYKSTIDIFQTGKFEIGKTHGSSIVLYNNYVVATENIKKNPLFGTGLGSHPTAFEKYSITKHIKIAGFDLNSEDANSMFLRLMSETGIFGLTIFLFIFFRFFIRRNKNYLNHEEPHWIIANSLFILIGLNLLRQGHYFLNGFPFFIWLYYFNWKSYQKFKGKVIEKDRISIY